jgi:hypothetical protein
LTEKTEDGNVEHRKTPEDYRGTVGAAYEDALRALEEAVALYAGRRTGAGEGPGRGMRTQALPRAWQEHPVRARRAARVVRVGQGVSLAAVTRVDCRFGVEPTRAQCVSGRKFFAHAAPDLDCTCGWYSVKPGRRSDWEGSTYVQLAVELDGAVIEHDRGYRAQRQRVTAVYLGNCACGRQARGVQVSRYYYEAVSRCWRCRFLHLDGGRRWWSVRRLAQTLGVPVERGDG